MIRIKHGVLKVLIIIAVILLCNIIIPINNVQANKNKVLLYSIGEIKNLLIYNGIKVATQEVVYNVDGREYPAYCLNRNIEGITLTHSYEVNTEKEIENKDVWKAIINGYPYKTYTELGCANRQEAYVATKMAVYDMLYNYNYNEFSPVGEAGNRVFQAMKSIAYNARNSNETRKYLNLDFCEESENWNTEKEYIIKTYTVSTEAPNYTVSVECENISDINIMDIQGKSKLTFARGEKFQIKIPIKELKEDGTFKINVFAQMKTNSILHGEPMGNLQDYAIMMNPVESVKKEIIQNYSKNKTEIQILKIDGETKKGLQGIKFSLLNEEKKVIQKDLITDENGMIKIKGILHGKYYIQEDETLENYEKYNELVEVELNYNETKIVQVDNFKIPKQIEILQDENIQTVELEEIKLPRTGY